MCEGGGGVCVKGWRHVCEGGGGMCVRGVVCLEV